MNRSIVTQKENAQKVAEMLSTLADGAIVNGIPWFSPTLKQDVQLVTVINRKETIKNTSIFKKLKKEGFVINASRA